MAPSGTSRPERGLKRTVETGNSYGGFAILSVGAGATSDELPCRFEVIDTDYHTRVGCQIEEIDVDTRRSETPSEPTERTRTVLQRKH